jgi:hypothetical protein
VAKELGEQVHRNTSDATLYGFQDYQEMGLLKIKRGPGKQWVEGKTFRLAEEVRYIQRRAARHDGRIVTLGQLLLFSTETGDAWLLDPSDQLAAPIARDGDPLPVHIGGDRHELRRGLDRSLSN